MGDAIRERTLAARERADRATGGPWRLVIDPDVTGLIPHVLTENDGLIAEGFDPEFLSDDVAANNTTFIAHARADVPTMADDIDTLLAENERLRKALRAEREQCAAIARRFPETWKGHGTYTVHAVSTAIAKAIEEED